MRADLFEKRKYLIIGFISIIFLIMLVKLFFIQIVNKSYKVYADNNSIKEKIIYPGRGLIYDRNGNLIVCNEAVYDLLITPNLVKKNFDTTTFCKLVNIDLSTFEELLSKSKKYSRYKPSVFISQIPKEEIASIEESLYMFDGIEIQARTVRKYPFPVGAHVFGDVGEVSESFLKNNPEYRLGDYTGLNGLEKKYENELKGVKGVKQILVNVHNVEMGSYNNGENDISALQGNNLILELDIELQAYAEKLMKHKKGSIVVIDPKTGGILTLVSAPTYNPNLLVGRERSKNYSMLVNDTVYTPLLNRALLGEYPPGSTFKMFNGLIALQNGTISQNTKFSCAGPNATPIKCTHNHESPLSIVAALRESCNPYFRLAFENYINSFASPADGLNSWAKTAHSFGLGEIYNTDLAFSRKGNIPDANFYNRIYPNQKWKSSTIRSLSIGQGEILVTPIQLANYVTVIANNGQYTDPHFVRAIISPEDTIHPFEKNVHKALVDEKHFKVIKDGMHEVVKSGTARWYGQVEGIDICGKTGTVQNAGENHALFVGFAPKDNPQIAIAVVVENSGYGSTFAVPIASLLIEYYLNREIKRHHIEEHVLNTKLIEY
ncbi:penicillin-binding protein 2 [Odoribacter sp. OttesenSCG-928-L07]|nr:penicillin-binding protein 2 [Odoribacter sp. OttesenSCG-928-L07]MDL2239334.1 penicillin-binding protein 2 [Bacteroidales bacterium OttesenSCG-928-L14]MDL2240379.1 penicillin-binding protein 2 [Bacteroidales bacterium OttesenSCG-928-K22]